MPKGPLHGSGSVVRRNDLCQGCGCLLSAVQNYQANALLERPICVKWDGNKPALQSPSDECVDRADGVDQLWHVYSNNDDFQNNNTVHFRDYNPTVLEVLLMPMVLSGHRVCTLAY